MHDFLVACAMVLTVLRTFVLDNLQANLDEIVLAFLSQEVHDSIRLCCAANVDASSSTAARLGMCKAPQDLAS